MSIRRYEGSRVDEWPAGRAVACDPPGAPTIGPHQRDRLTKVRYGSGMLAAIIIATIDLGMGLVVFLVTELAIRRR